MTPLQFEQRPREFRAITPGDVVCSILFMICLFFLPAIAGTQSRRDDAGRDLAGLAADFHAVKRGIIALYLERVCSQNVGASPVISGVCD